jgi:transcription termination factor NusB
MKWENAGVTNLNHIMDTVIKNFLTFEKIETLIKRILQVALLNTSYKRHLSKMGY